jgi:AcrR family transcriptional regulator
MTQLYHRRLKTASVTYIFMTNPRNTARQKLLDSAIALFARQGITETTTKQIAELADVNEVTLFRQFGNKQGLLLAMLEESDIFEQLTAYFDELSQQELPPHKALAQYSESCLALLSDMPELLRSLIGEAGKYSPDLKQALGQGIQRANHALAIYLEKMKVTLAPSQIGLLHHAILGYQVLDLTTEFHELWPDRSAFIREVVGMVMDTEHPSHLSEPIQDLPALIVHQIFQRAQKQGVREWALVYLLFGAGVSPLEVVRLERFHYIRDRDGQFLQISQGATRQVPLNQWIMGKRYGTYQKNPLTQWLKSRKDTQTTLFVGTDEQPLRIEELHHIWQSLTDDLITLAGQPPTLDQPQQTWRVEMLMRGLSLDDMLVLTGLSIEQLTPYAQRAKQKAVIEHGIALDKQKPTPKLNASSSDP